MDEHLNVEPLSVADLAQGDFSSAAEIDAVPLKDSDRAWTGRGDIGDERAGSDCHRSDPFRSGKPYVISFSECNERRGTRR
jgi:hypothetical protein